MGLNRKPLFISLILHFSLIITIYRLYFYIFELIISFLAENKKWPETPYFKSPINEVIVRLIKKEENIQKRNKEWEEDLHEWLSHIFTGLLRIRERWATLVWTSDSSSFLNTCR